jgi:hypothetical protein
MGSQGVLELTKVGYFGLEAPHVCGVWETLFIHASGSAKRKCEYMYR